MLKKFGMREKFNEIRIWDILLDIHKILKNVKFPRLCEVLSVGSVGTQCLIVKLRYFISSTIFQKYITTLSLDVLLLPEPCSYLIIFRGPRIVVWTKIYPEIFLLLLLISKNFQKCFAEWGISFNILTVLFSILLNGGIVRKINLCGFI